MAINLIRHAARTLCPDRPIKMIMEFHRVPRPTAKSWYTGHRRAPVWILACLRRAAWVRGMLGLAQELDYLIRRRENEPPRRTGFCSIDPLTGRDRRNRLGRRKRI
jgi:hypothetical protein